MRRYLVVAHQTLGGEALIEEVRSRYRDGQASFHLLVPVHHPSNHPWTEAEVNERAHEVLAEGIERFHELGIEVSGEVGDANPVYAVGTVLRRDPDAFDEIILSTFPSGPSRWLHWDVPSRLGRLCELPITHVVAERHPATS